MKLQALLDHYAKQLADEKGTAVTQGLDTPIETHALRGLGTAGTYYLYALGIPHQTTLPDDVPLTILPADDLEPTEGYVLQCQKGETIIQAQDSLSQATSNNTVIPDTTGFFETASKRLADMATHPESYALGPAERLLAWLDPDPEADHSATRATASPSVLTTVWNEDQAARWTKLGPLIVDLLRHNKRVLLIGPDHQAVDTFTGFLAKTLRTAALPYKSLVSRYDVAVIREAFGHQLHELGFEVQMSGFFSKSRSNKSALQKQYDRFRKLTPILAYKTQKQRDLNEVKLLEWRLLAQVSEFQGKIKEIDKTLAEYEAIPIWKRLAMQAAGKNVATLGEYRAMYDQNIQSLMKEVEIAQARIRELAPEAAIPKDLRPEYEELKEEITRLGGTQKIREMLAASEATNRQAFIQNKRIVATTPGRVLTDPLFQKVRFDVLIAENAPRIPAPFLLGAAGLIRERIIISGQTQDLSSPEGESKGSRILWRQHCLGDHSVIEPKPSEVA